MKLTREEQQFFNYRKIETRHTYEEIALTLGITSDDVFKASTGQPISDDVYQAIKEWLT